MICLKHYFSLFLFALFGSFFISLSLSANDTYAVADLVISSSTSSEVCPSCYSSGYRFATFYFDSIDPSSSSYSNISIIAPGSSLPKFFRLYPVTPSVTFLVEDGTRFGSVNFATPGHLVFSLSCNP